MTIQLASQQVWEALRKEIFAVLGMVTAGGAARTVGIVYVLYDQKLYLVSRKEAWKVQHVARNPNVSITVPIAKRVPFMPWIKIPAATITFSGTGKVLQTEMVKPEVMRALLGGVQPDSTSLSGMRVIEIEPTGEFITYGIGVSLMGMRNPEKARGRAPVL
jgi:hypothetical protein